MKRKGAPFFANDLRGDLDNIVLMAMRKEPERRYSSVQALHEEIDDGRFYEFQLRSTRLARDATEWNRRI